LVTKRGYKHSSAIVLESDKATKSLGKGDNTRDKYSECWQWSLMNLVRKVGGAVPGGAAVRKFLVSWPGKRLPLGGHGENAAR
jgi:hypothetical protein